MNVPEVIWPLSSERVITTEFVPGVHIDKARQCSLLCGMCKLFQCAVAGGSAGVLLAVLVQLERAAHMHKHFGLGLCIHVASCCQR